MDTTAATPERKYKSPAARWNRSPSPGPSSPEFHTPSRSSTTAPFNGSPFTTPSHKAAPLTPRYAPPQNTPVDASVLSEQEYRMMEIMRPEDGWHTLASRKLGITPTATPGTPKRIPVAELWRDTSVVAGNKRSRDEVSQEAGSDDLDEEGAPSTSAKRRQIETTVYQEETVRLAPMMRSTASRAKSPGTPRSRLKLKSTNPNAKKDLRWHMARATPVDHDRTHEMARKLLEDTDRAMRERREAEESSRQADEERKAQQLRVEQEAARARAEALRQQEEQAKRQRQQEQELAAERRRNDERRLADEARKEKEQRETEQQRNAAKLALPQVS
ncbi:hypothetical protein HKX48_004274 [Thoreauomyces humboldtii]|nr:hypothetical protein HKX48_004274 [Thoreauomyces humboldtii]